MLRKVISVVLILLAGFLAYKVYDTIVSEIRYQEEVKQVEEDVIDRLKKIREAQLVYKAEKGKFADRFEFLLDFIKNDSMSIIQEFGDKDDTSSVYTRNIIRVSVRDSMFKNYPIDSLPIVPHTGKTFEMTAKVINQNNVNVPVFEVKDPAPISRERKENDNPLKVGSLTEVSYQGNWD